MLTAICVCVGRRRDLVVFEKFFYFFFISYIYIGLCIFYFTSHLARLIELFDILYTCFANIIIMSTCSSNDGESIFKYKLCKNVTYHKDMKLVQQLSNSTRNNTTFYNNNIHNIIFVDVHA